MARYRIGNKFLSQSEYDNDQDTKWMGGLFLVGALITGFLLHYYLVNPEWHKAIRFTVTTVPAIGVGVLCAILRHVIQMIMGLAIILAVIALIISIISSLI